MKKVFLLVSVCFVCINAGSQTLEWAKQMGAGGDDYGRSIAVDAQGNVYTVGTFVSVVDFDPGPGIFNMTCTTGFGGHNDDIFIQKLDAAGNFIWAKSIGNQAYQDVRAVKLDNNGHIYLTGWSVLTADFDPGPGVYNLNQGCYVLKLDTSGTFQWAKLITGNSSQGFGLFVDKHANVYVSGVYAAASFSGPVVLDAATNDTAIEFGGYDIFIAKWDSSGNYQWGKSMGSAADDFVASIAVDDSDNVYTTGSFQGTMDIDPGANIYPVVSNGASDIFIQKLTAQGNFAWAKTVGGSGYDGSNGLAVDKKGNPVIIGGFTGNVDFDPTPAIFNINGGTEGSTFIWKLDNNGDFILAKAIVGSGVTYAHSLTLDGLDNIYMTGEFGGTTDFDPDMALTYNLTSASIYDDIFIVKRDSSATFKWAISMGDPIDQCWGETVVVDTANIIYVTGIFANNVDFDPGPGTTILTTTADRDIFILKLNDKTTLPITLLSFSGEPVDENVALHWKVTREMNVSGYEIERGTSTAGMITIGKVKAKASSGLINAYSFLDNAVPDLNPLLYRLKMIEQDGRSTYSKVIDISRHRVHPTFSIFPNPATTTVQLQFDKNVTGKIDIQVMDMSGKVALQSKLSVLNGVATLATGNLLAGTYMMKVSIGKELYVQKIVVNR